MPVGDALSKWATTLYNNFPNRPKRMSALDAANAMKAMAEAKRANEEAYALRMGYGKGGGEQQQSKGGGGEQHQPQQQMSRVPTAPTLTSPGGSGMGALPTAATSAMAPMAGQSFDYSPMLDTGGTGSFDTFGMNGDYGDFGLPPAPVEAPSDTASPTAPADGINYAAGMGGLNQGFGQQQAQIGDQPTSTPMQNSALPASYETTNPETTVAYESYAGGTYSSTAGKRVGEDEMVIPAEMNPYRDMPDTPIVDNNEAKFAPGLYAAKQVAGVLPSAESVGRAIVETPVNLVRGAADLVGRGAKAWAGMSASPDQVAQNMTGRFARAGLPSGAETPPPSAEQPKMTAQATPQISADVQRVLDKPQMTAKDFYAKNPGMEGAWDRMKQGATAVPGALPQMAGTESGSSGSPMKPVGPTRTTYMNPEQANTAWGAIQGKNATSAGIGGGGMAVHGEDGNITTINALPSNAERGVKPNLMGDAQETAIRSLEGQYRRNELSDADYLAGLGAIQKMNAPDKAAMALIAEQGKNARADATIKAQNERMDKMIGSRQGLQQNALAAKATAEEDKRGHKLYESYVKEHEEALKAEDPEERARRTMLAKASYYGAVLPKEYKGLADVPDDFDNFVAKYNQERFKNKMPTVTPEDKAGIAKLKAAHQKLIGQREAVLEQNRQAQNRR
jgi:hypothetical protein